MFLDLQHFYEPLNYLIISYFVFYFFIKFFYFKFILIYTFIGTVFHELAHFSMGVTFYAKPVWFSLIPKRNGDSYVLGSVEFENIRFYNALPVALAPLVLNFFAYQLYFYSLSLDIHFKIAFSFLIFNLIISSIPSSTDIKVILNKFSSIIFYILIILVYYLFINNYFKEFSFNEFSLVISNFLENSNEF